MVPIRQVMLPEIMAAQAGADREFMAELRKVATIADLRVDSWMPFAMGRFSGL